MSDVILARALTTGDAVSSPAEDNATATATLAALDTVGGQGRYFLTGVACDFSATVAAVKTVTITWTDSGGTSSTLVLRRTYAEAGFVYRFPSPLGCRIGTGAAAALEASGTGGVTGRVTLFYQTV